MNTVRILLNVMCFLGAGLSLNARSRFSQNVIDKENKKKCESLKSCELLENKLSFKNSSLSECESSVCKESDFPKNESSHLDAIVINPLVQMCPESLTPSLQELVHDVKIAIERLQGDVDEKKEHLKERTETQIDAMKTKIEHDIERLKCEAKINTENLKKELKQESVRLSHAAAHKTLEIVSQAELDAVKLRAQARQEALQQKFAHTGIDLIAAEKNSELIKEENQQKSELPNELLKEEFLQTSLYKFEPTQLVDNEKNLVTTEWKNMISHEFYQDMAFLKKIIVDGETSETERQDYLNRFKDQNKWFDTTLSSTRYFQDHSYEEIVEKKAHLRSLINAQRDADIYFENASKNLALNEDKKKKIRLMVLYDLYEYLAKKSYIEHSQIKRFVTKILDEYSLTFRAVSGKFSDVEITPEFTTTAVVSPQVKNLEEKLDQTKKRLSVTKTKKKQLKIDATQKLQEKATAYIELEMNFETLHAQLKHAQASMHKAQVKARHERVRKDELLKQLKKCEEEKLTLIIHNQTSKEYVEKVKRDHDKKYMKLKIALDHAILQAQKHEHKACALSDEVETVRSKLVEAKVNLKKTKTLVKYQNQLLEENQNKTLLAEKIAQKELDDTHVTEKKGDETSE